jgi:adenosylcobinamide-GDP ribazoletransferase
MKPDCPAWAPPLLAIQFLTRVPVPAVSRLPEGAIKAGLGRAVGWYPLIGALIGTVTATTFLLTQHLWPTIVAVLLALIVEARLTGAFHEDAVADFCDGVGGGKDPAHARQIMKDSRIGTFGALGLVLGVATRAALMFSLNPAIALYAIVAAATLGRLLTVIVMVTTPPAPAATSLARDVAANIRPRDIALAAITSLPGLLPLALVQPIAFAATAGAAAVFIVWFRALVIRKVGGATGDCVGAAAYAGQLLTLLAATAVTLPH